MKHSGWLLSLAVVAVAIAGLWPLRQYGHFVLELATGVFKLFDDNSLPPAIAAVMVVIAGILLLGYQLLYVAPIRRHVKELSRTIRGVPDKNFTAKFHTVDDALKKDPLIRHGWQEFHETLIMPRGEAGGKIKNTIRPHDYINISCALHERPGLKQMSSVPGYFIGIGLLLTFVGLLAALNAASGSVAAPDVAEAQNSLKILLQAAAFKFWTSIAGIFCSMFLSFFFRRLMGTLEGAFEDICTALEEKLAYVSPQSISESIERTTSEQLAETKKINTEVAFTIGHKVSETLSEQMPKHLREAIEPLASEVSRAAGKIGSSSEEGMKEMLGKFMDILERSAGKEMQGLAESLSEMGAVLGELRTSVQAAGSGVKEDFSRMAEEFGRQVGNAASRLEQTARKSEEAVTRLSAEVERSAKEANARIAEGAGSAGESMRIAGQNVARSISTSVESVLDDLREQMASLTSSVEALDHNFQDQAEALSSLADRSSAAASDFDRMVGSLREAADPLQSTAESIARSASKISDAAQSASSALGTTQDRAQQLSESLQASVGETRELWQTYQGRFENIDTSLEQAFQKMTQGVRDSSDVISEFLKKLDKSFKQSLDSLAGAVEVLQEIVEDLETERKGEEH